MHLGQNPHSAVPVRSAGVGHEMNTEWTHIRNGHKMDMKWTHIRNGHEMDTHPKRTRNGHKMGTHPKRRFHGHGHHEWFAVIWRGVSYGSPSRPLPPPLDYPTHTDWEQRGTTNLSHSGAQKSPRRGLLDQVQAQAPCRSPFGGHLRSIPQGMVSDDQPLVKSSFWETNPPMIFSILTPPPP